MEGVRWAVNVGRWAPTRAEWLEAMRLVQVQGGERDRIRRFAYAHDAKASLMGRLLLRRLGTVHIWPGRGQESFSRSEKGRPELVDSRGWDFNVSHQGSFAVLAAEKGDGVKVGVDVMRMTDRQRDLDEFFHLMRRQFTPNEWAWIKSGGEDGRRLARFYRVWCLKESFVKADGRGLNWNLQRLDFKVETDDVDCEKVTCDSKLFVDGAIAKGWHFHESLLDDQHCVCVAFSAANVVAATKFKVLKTFDEVIRGSAEYEGDLDEEEEWNLFSAKNPDKPF